MSQLEISASEMARQLDVAQTVILKIRQEMVLMQSGKASATLKVKLANIENWCTFVLSAMGADDAR